MANKKPAELKSKLNTDVLTWMKESRALLPSVDAFHDNNITKSYVKKNISIIKRQLFYAGFRLASVLAMVFKN